MKTPKINSISVALIIMQQYVTSFVKPATYAHYGKEQFSSSMDSSINKLTTSTPLPNGFAFAEA